MKEGWKEEPRRVRGQTVGFSLQRLTLSEGFFQSSIIDSILDFFASIFSHETGIYFKGKKYYTIKALGICTITIFLILISLFFIIFGPLMTDMTVKTELQISSFSRPITNRKPSGLSQLFGQEVSLQK